MTMSFFLNGKQITTRSSLCKNSMHFFFVATARYPLDLGLGGPQSRYEHNPYRCQLSWLVNWLWSFAMNETNP